MTYATVVGLLWAIIATERIIYWKGEYKFKECEFCGK